MPGLRSCGRKQHPAYDRKPESDGDFFENGRQSDGFHRGDTACRVAPGGGAAPTGAPSGVSSTIRTRCWPASSRNSAGRASAGSTTEIARVSPSRRSRSFRRTTKSGVTRTVIPAAEKERRRANHRVITGRVEYASNHIVKIRSGARLNDGEARPLAADPVNHVRGDGSIAVDDQVASGGGLQNRRCRTLKHDAPYRRPLAGGEFRTTGVLHQELPRLPRAAAARSRVLLLRAPLPGSLCSPLRVIDLEGDGDRRGGRA